MILPRSAASSKASKINNKLNKFQQHELAKFREELDWSRMTAIMSANLLPICFPSGEKTCYRTWKQLNEKRTNVNSTLKFIEARITSNWQLLNWSVGWVVFDTCELMNRGSLKKFYKLFGVKLATVLNFQCSLFGFE